MEKLIDELIDRVWNTPSLSIAIGAIQRSWLQRKLGFPEEPISKDEARRYLEVAAILACSTSEVQRRVAYRMATTTYELFGEALSGADAALRVILTRLGNFPGLATSAPVNNSLANLPWALAGEEVARRAGNSVALKTGELVLTDFQRKLWTMLSNGNSIAISAPTSAGKSFVLQAFITHRLAGQRNFAACYVVPTRALITQVSQDLSLALSSSGLNDVEVVTVPVEADEPLPPEGVYVLTQERLQLLLTNHPLKRFDFLVIDEAQSVQDGDRGVLLQSAIDELLARGEFTQTLFASPTVENLSVFGQMSGIANLVTSRTEAATVAQNFIVANVAAPRQGEIELHSVSPEGTASIGKKALGHSLNSRIESLVHVSHQLGKDDQSIVYANGQADAEKIAFQISDLRRSDGSTPDADLLALSDLAKEAVHPKYVLADTVLRGVGFHYGNIPTLLRSAMETAFKEGSLRYLVCTSTLLAGVNLPAKNLFMCMPQKSKGKALQSVDFWNLAGRAGRLRREFQGNIYLIGYEDWEVKALDGPSSQALTPAIEATLRDRIDEVSALALDDKFRATDAGLETIFLKLLVDKKLGRVSSTLTKAAVRQGSAARTKLEEALAFADRAVTLRPEILAASPTISPHRQQKLYDAFAAQISRGGRDAARNLLLRHPRESDKAFNSYVAALDRCHGVLSSRAGSTKQNRFFALMILKWMQGISIAELVDGRMEFSGGDNIATAIRGTLDLVEKELRFNYVRLFGCYNELLREAMIRGGQEAEVSSISSIPLYLEIGASDKTMISFVSLGLSRLVSKKLNDICPNKNMGTTEARQWLARQNLESLGFSRYLRMEVDALSTSKLATE